MSGKQVLNLLLPRVRRRRASKAHPFRTGSPHDSRKKNRTLAGPNSPTEPVPVRGSCLWASCCGGHAIGVPEIDVGNRFVDVVKAVSAGAPRDRSIGHMVNELHGFGLNTPGFEMTQVRNGRRDNRDCGDSPAALLVMPPGCMTEARGRLHRTNDCAWGLIKRSSPEMRPGPERTQVPPTIWAVGGAGAAAPVGVSTTPQDLIAAILRVVMPALLEI